MERNAVRMFFEARGQAPQALLLDGIGCDGYAWRYLKGPLVTRGGFCHAHYRGHGNSRVADPSSCDVSIPALAEDALAILDHLGVDEPVILAHSMGVQVALEVALKRPVRALVLISGVSGQLASSFHEGLLKQALPFLLRAAETHERTTRALWRLAPSRIALGLAKLLGEVEGDLIISEDFVRYWRGVRRVHPLLFLRMLAEAENHDLSGRLGNLTAPTLILSGTHDRFVPPERARALAESLPNAQLRLYPKATHALPAEFPKQTRDDIITFLDNVVAGPRPATHL